MRLAPYPERSGRRRRLPTQFVRLDFVVRIASLVAVIAAGLTLGAIFGLTGTSDGPASAERPALPDTNAPLVLYAEFSPDSDAVWAADPDDPEDRAQLASIPHAHNYGSVGSLSPNGTRIAYNVLPPEETAPAPDVPAQLWVLDLEEGTATLTADGVDLLVAPVWAPDGDSVVVRRSHWIDGEGGRFEITRVGLDGAAEPLVSSADALFPVDYAADSASVYYASITEGGTELRRATGASNESVAHLSGGYTRDWSFSPDGARLAFLTEGTRTAFEARVFDLEKGGAEPAVAGAGAADEFGLAWRADGSLTLGRADGAIRQVRDNVASSLPGESSGFDVPLSWSPDGARLALRGFEGASLSDPGRSFVFVLGPNGERRLLSKTSDVAVLGWLGASR